MAQRHLTQAEEDALALDGDPFEDTLRVLGPKIPRLLRGLLALAYERTPKHLHWVNDEDPRVKRARRALAQLKNKRPI